MFNGMRGFGAPGGREQRFSNTETEVRIPLKQTVYAIGALIVVAFIIQRGVVIPLAVRLCAGRSWCQPLQIAVFNALWRLAVALPLALYAYANVLNVLDPNWTPPRSAAPAETGPFVPGFLRWPLRWLGRTAKVPETQNYNAPTATATAETPREFTLEWCEHGNKRAKRRATVGLFLDDWRLLGVLAQSENARFSVRALQDAGFKQPRDREILALLKEVALVESRGNSTTAIEPFRLWLASAGHDHSPKPGEVISI